MCTHDYNFFCHFDAIIMDFRKSRAESKQQRNYLVIVLITFYYIGEKKIWHYFLILHHTLLRRPEEIRLTKHFDTPNKDKLSAMSLTIYYSHR